MGINKLIEVVVFVILLIASTGRLPQFVHKTQVVQLRLLKASQSKSWGRAIVLKPHQ